MVALFIFLQTCTSLAEGVFIKKYNSKHDKGGFVFTAFISVFALMFFIATDKGGITVPPMMWFYGIAGGVLYSTASILTYMALGCGSFAMSMLILSYGLIFPIGYGLIFLKDPVSLFTCIGLVLMLLSIYLVKEKTSDEKVKISAKWVVYISLSVFLAGMFSVVQKMQQLAFENEYTNEFMIVALATSAIILLTCGLIKDGKNLGYILKYGTLWTAGAGVANAITNMLTMATNQLMPISIASPVRAGAKIIMSFLLSMFMFKEKFTKKQYVGVALGTAALVLLNL